MLYSSALALFSMQALFFARMAYRFWKFLIGGGESAVSADSSHQTFAAGIKVSSVFRATRISSSSCGFPESESRLALTRSSALASLCAREFFFQIIALHQHGLFGFFRALSRLVR